MDKLGQTPETPINAFSKNHVFHLVIFSAGSEKQRRYDAKIRNFYQGKACGNWLECVKPKSNKRQLLHVHNTSCCAHSRARSNNKSAGWAVVIDISYTTHKQMHMHTHSTPLHSTHSHHTHETNKSSQFQSQAANQNHLAAAALYYLRSASLFIHVQVPQRLPRRCPLRYKAIDYMIEHSDRQLA